jgi:tetratricopeptide (TPR) repeat protein
MSCNVVPSSPIILTYYSSFQPSDPLERSVSLKNKGNKYFRGGRYELAIKCYTEAIEGCPSDKPHDLATFYQNRAAAFDQLVSISYLNKLNSANAKYRYALVICAWFLKFTCCGTRLEYLHKCKFTNPAGLGNKICF